MHKLRIQRVHVELRGSCAGMFTGAIVGAAPSRKDHCSVVRLRFVLRPPKWTNKQARNKTGTQASEKKIEKRHREERRATAQHLGIIIQLVPPLRSKPKDNRGSDER